MKNQELICFNDQEEFDDYEEGLKAFNHHLFVLRNAFRKYSNNESQHGFVILLTLCDGVMVSNAIYYDGLEVELRENNPCDLKNDKFNIYMFIIGEYAGKISAEFNRLCKSYPKLRFKNAIIPDKKACWSSEDDPAFAKVVLETLSKAF